MLKPLFDIAGAILGALLGGAANGGSSDNTSGTRPAVTYCPTCGLPSTNPPWIDCRECIKRQERVRREQGF